MNDNYSHISVCAEKVFELLSPAIHNSQAILIDATVGLGGHSEYFLSRLPNVHVIGIDRDVEALEIARNRLARFAPRVFFYHATFADITSAYRDSPWCADYCVAAILADFGVSSLQLDNPLRGFSYARDEQLDMRMDQTQELTAADVLAKSTKVELTKILQQFGQERFAASIAAHIVKQREVEPITHTGQLVELIYRAIPAAARRKGGHPAKRTFQALRIAVNNELNLIEHVLVNGFDLLAPGGRFVCLSFHSLEDSMVKNFFATMTSSRMPPNFPIDVPGYGPRAKNIVRGSYQASAEEVLTNPRASSVRVRGIEKISHRT